MRSSAGELRLALRMMTAYALAFPAVGFHLSVDGRRRFSAPPSSTLRERLVALYGAHFVERLLETGEERLGISVTAFVGVPDRNVAELRENPLDATPDPARDQPRADGKGRQRTGPHQPVTLDATKLIQARGIFDGAFEGQLAFEFAAAA